jgi:hypothetical protein
MLASFSGSVIETVGRTPRVQPLRQIVDRIVDCVTAGLSAPGVQRGSGREYTLDPRAWQLPVAGWRWIVVALAFEYGRPLGATRASDGAEAVSAANSATAGSAPRGRRARLRGGTRREGVAAGIWPREFRSLR